MSSTDTKFSHYLSQAKAIAQQPRSKRVARWSAGLVLALGLFGFFAAPPLLKSVLLKQLSAELHRQVSIEKIDINPYALSARISGVKVVADSGDEVFGFDELFVNLSAASLFKFGVVVDEFSLRAPRVAVTRLEDGRYDISDLLDEWLKPSEPKPTPRFSLNNIQIIGGQIRFSDQPVKKVHDITDLTLRVPFVSSLPYQADILVQPHFSATVDGSKLVLEGQSKPFSESRESQLNLDLDHFDLGGLQAYLPDSLPFRLRSATVDSELKLVFKALPGEVFSVALEGAAHLRDLLLAERSGAHLLGWKALDVDFERLDLINQNFAVRDIAFDGLEVSVGVDRKGELNWLALVDQLSAKPAGQKEAAATEPGKPVTWSLGGLSLKNGVVHWSDESNIKPVKGDMKAIQLNIGKMDGSMAEPLVIEKLAYQLDMGERLRLDDMQINQLRLDLAKHVVEIGEVSNASGQIRMLRNKAGQIDWVTSPVLKTAKAVAKSGPEVPWTANLEKLAINKLAFRLDDQTTSTPAVQEINNFRLLLEGLSTEPGKKAKLALDAQVNAKGSLKVGGNVQLSPLQANLQIETLAVPLLPLQPYFTDFLNIALTRGQVSSKGELIAQTGKAGLNTSYKGNLTVGDLLTVDKLNNADFLKWKSLYFGGIEFNSLPMSVNIGEIALSDFYSRLIVSPQGRLNLQDMVKKSAEPVESVAAAVPPTVEPAAPLGKIGAAPAKAAATAPAEPMPITIRKITLQGGKVNFSDFFVKPNYTVNLTKVGGRVSNLSSSANTVADMELRASYANTAPVSVVAKLNPLAAKSYLDLKADVTGVDLVPFSPYSGKYAGYNIEKGKLSLNVSYKLEEGKLLADNRLFIDQLTFGDKVNSPDATSLPVNLAISLLKNSRGEIDLNLPIAGSLDDPQFSVGGLVVKVIVNLFVKAVTSPFALLGSMFGGGEELSNIEFAPGRAQFSDAAGKKLEALAKALRERESLKLEITGRADPESDKEGFKRVAMERAMRVEKQKDLLKQGKEADSVESIELSEADYPVYLKRAYKEAKFPKPRNLVGMQKDLPVDEMEKLMLTNLPASAEDIRTLANHRAEQVQAWLVEQGKVPASRIFLATPKLEADDKGKASRVDFALK